jgi:hypothetical protein
MNMLRKQVGLALVMVAGMLACGVASAAVVMTFDQQNGNGEYVDNYYNGGCGGSYGGGSVTCGGPNYGVVWNGALEGYAPNGLWNNTSNSSSPPGVIGFLDSDNAYMNVAAGFDTGFSFYYAAANVGGTIEVWSGLNGTGTMLASLSLPVTGADCDGITSFSCWDPIGVTFAGTAMSVNFAGTANQIVFDNVTIGSGTPINGVPEPTALGMFGLGTLLLGLFAGMRRRAQKKGLTLQ